MAWTSPTTFTEGAVLTAAEMNTYVRDNMLETAPAKATTAGGIFVATGANTIAERIPAGATVSNSQTTVSSESFVDLTTVGPSVTLNTGTKAIVSIYASCQTNVDNTAAVASFAVSGATTIAAADSRGIQNDGMTAGNPLRIGATFFQSGLTAGSNTFTLKYRCPSATGTFSDRHIVVVPL